MKFKILRDKAKTRVDVSAITSYSSDFDILPPNGKVDTLWLSIGSAVRKLSYNSSDDRELDIKELDVELVDSDLR